MDPNTKQTVALALKRHKAVFAAVALIIFGCVLFYSSGYLKTKNIASFEVTAVDVRLQYTLPRPAALAGGSGGGTVVVPSPLTPQSAMAYVAQAQAAAPVYSAAPGYSQSLWVQSPTTTQNAADTGTIYSAGDIYAALAAPNFVNALRDNHILRDSTQVSLVAKTSLTVSVTCAGGVNAEGELQAIAKFAQTYANAQFGARVDSLLAGAQNARQSYSDLAAGDMTSITGFVSAHDGQNLSMADYMSFDSTVRDYATQRSRVSAYDDLIQMYKSYRDSLPTVNLMLGGVSISGSRTSMFAALTLAGAAAAILAALFIVWVLQILSEVPVPGKEKK